MCEILAVGSLTPLLTYTLSLSSRSPHALSASRRRIVVRWASKSYTTPLSVRFEIQVFRADRTTFVTSASAALTEGRPVVIFALDDAVLPGVTASA